MALANRIDPATAAANLGRWLGAPVTDVEIPRSSGMSCETVLFRSDGRRYVARVAPEDGVGLFPTYRLEDEAAVMRALADTPVPAPRIVAVETDRAVLGGRFLVMEHVGGRVPPDDPPYSTAGWVLDLTPAEQTRLVDDAIATIVDVSRADTSGLRLPQVGVMARVEHLDHLHETGHRGTPHPTIAAGLDYLRANAPTDEELVLSWGDARIGNMLFDDDMDVVGALDWELASINSRELDVAYFLYALRLWSEGFGAPSPAGFPDRTGVLARFEELSGVPMQYLDYYERLAAVFGAIAMLRAGHLMIDAGLVPAESTVWLTNPPSVLLAGYLDLPVPTGESVSWVGNR